MSDRHRKAPAPPVVERNLIDASFPGPDGSPLWRLRLELQQSTQGGGERLRLRARLQARLGNLFNVPEPHAALPPAGHGRIGRALAHGAQRVGGMAVSAARRGATVPVLRYLAQPLIEHDFHSWIEIEASTAQLNDEAGALLTGSRDKLAALGATLPAGSGVRTWVGEQAAGNSLAQVSLLRMNKRDLPVALRALFGRKPFQLAAAVAGVIERHQPYDKKKPD